MPRIDALRSDKLVPVTGVGPAALVAEKIFLELGFETMLFAKGALEAPGSIEAAEARNMPRKN